MKPATTKRICLITLILALAATAASAQPPAAVPQIRVTGESQLTIAPDHAVVTIRMENKAQSPRVAEELHKKIQGNALKALKEQNIPDSDTATAGPYLGTGNTTASTLAVTIRSLDRLAPLVQALSNKPNTKVETIAYSHTQLETLKEKSRTQALLNAKTKALSMTQTLEIQLGQAIYIRETDTTLSTNPTGPGTPGIQIKNKIEVIFQLGTGED